MIYTSSDYKACLPQKFDLTYFISISELEWMLGKTGAIKTEIEEDPRPKPKPRDILFTSLRNEVGGDNDWF